ncbi:hypothetical protein CEXT_750141 [Caerostris extrusa]|uniref:Uncharacterized protein n=1 Tax=Caerostris extrusa TaxID=172846 RepID=A0AAV4NTM0_CAEEX|nr:hypothetical protein CEXT_750141 [Caerostris extrusa]
MDNLIGYGLQNPNPFIPDTFPFINEHFQVDSENISCSDKSVAAKGIIDALDGSNNAHLQSIKVNAKQKSPFSEQNMISYDNNGFQLSSNTSKSSVVVSVKKRAEIYEIDSEEEVTPRRKRFNKYPRKFEFAKKIRSKWQKFKLQSGIKYEKLH